MEKVGIPVKGAGTRGCGLQESGDILQVIITGGANLRVRYVGDLPTHWEDSGRISSPGDPTTYGGAANTEGRWELDLPTTGSRKDRSRLGGCGDLRCPPSYHS